MSEGVRRPVNGQSLVRGTTDVPLSDDTVHQMLAHAAARWPQRDAAVFVEQGVRWTWAGLLAEVERAAAGLVALGVVKGDRVGIWSPNRAEWLVTQFATARIGAILVNINPAYRLSELEYALNKAGVSVLVTAPAFKTSDYLGMLQNLGFGADGHAERLPQLRTVVRMGDGHTAGMRRWADRARATPHCWSSWGGARRTLRTRTCSGTARRRRGSPVAATRAWTTRKR